MKIILATFDFPPKRGGIAAYSFELARALGDCYPGEVTVLAPEAARGDDVSSAFRFVTVPFAKSALLSSFTFAWMLTAAIKAQPAARLVCLNWYPCGLAAWLARIFTGHPYYVVAHGAELMERKSTYPSLARLLKRSLRLRVLGASAGVFPGSRFAASLVQSLPLGNRPPRVEVISYGVDAERFRPGPRREVPPTDLPFLLTVCRLDPHKGVDTALQALALCVKRGKPFVYGVVGAGPDSARLRTLAESLGVSSLVTFFGAVPDAELERLYRECDLFLLLSRELSQLSYVEGFGMVFLEAAASGKASIGSRSGGIPEAVVDGETGVLVAPGDPVSAADAILALLADGARLDRLAGAAFHRAREEMNWGAVARRLSSAMERDDA